MGCFHKIFARQERKKKLIAEVNRGEDWDWGYIYSLLAVKLENIRDYAQNDSVCDPKDWGIEWLTRAINLCRHLSGKSKYPSKININNDFRFLSKSELQFYHNPKNRLDHVYYREIYDYKAKNLLFEILKNKIELWWDQIIIFRY